MENLAFHKEIELPDHIIRIGEKGTGYTEKVQEWLNIHSVHNSRYNRRVAIDDWFGGGTQAALKEFQSICGIEPTGTVTASTWKYLVAPMERAFRTIDFPEGTDLRYAVLEYAKQMLVEHPIELNGRNEGPWVRALMNGHDGNWAAWCNGLISTLIDMATSSLGINMNSIIKWTWSCPEAMKMAKSNDYSAEWIDQDFVKKHGPDIVKPGDLGFVMGWRGNPNMPRHIFLIESINSDNIMGTIEGNTNDEGSAEGYEMCSRYRNANKGNIGVIKLIK